jgi:hypothetical protein
MKFSTVYIRPVGIKKKDRKWEVVFADLPFDRKNDGAGPNGMGFYHYPRRMGKKKAFEALKDHLIKCHEEEISLLTKSLSALKLLDM